jgi:hypothetical protein
MGDSIYQDAWKEQAICSHVVIHNLKKLILAGHEVEPRLGLQDLQIQSLHQNSTIIQVYASVHMYVLPCEPQMQQ